MALLGGQQKRKVAPEAIEQPLAKKAKRSKTSKHIAGQDHDRSITHGGHKNDEFRTLEAHMAVNIPASYTGPGRPRQAVLEMLDSILMQYVPNLQGVLLAHSDLEFASQTAMFLVDSSFAKVDVSFKATIWSPTVGSKLRGTISICSPDHIGLLIHKTFNVSIPRHHIPVDQWEFEYGSLENDPEHGGIAEDGDSQQQQDGEDGGRWVHKKTGEMIGGTSRQLEFMIIGLSIADAMLSLIGSVQPDPFSEEHKPQPAISYFTSGRNRRRSQYSLAEEESVADALLGADSDAEVEEPFTREEPQSEDELQEGEESDEIVGADHSLNDAFEQMGRETDQLTRELAQDAKKSKQQEKEEAKRKEEKRERKRKRRSERRSNGVDGGEEEARPKKKKKKDKST